MTTDDLQAVPARGPKDVNGARWRLAMVLLVALASVLVLYHTIRPHPLVLEIDARVETSAAGQIFHSQDTAYSEDRSQRFELKVGQRSTYRVHIPGKLPGTIRLDLGDRPGQITLYSIVLSRGGEAITFDPQGLATAIQPMGGVNLGSISDGLAIASLDTDPHFAIAVPDELGTRSWGSLLLAAAALFALVTLVWKNRAGIRSAVETVAMIRPALLWPVIGVLATFVILRVTGISLSGARPVQSLVAGSALMLAITAFAVVGRAVLHTGPRTHASGAFGFAGNAIVGQAVLLLYIYVRSIPGAFGVALPVTGLELIGLVLLCGIFQYRNRHVHTWTSTDTGLTVFQIAVLFVLCVVVADRELPRLVMLSSDPDSHAFFARQVMHFGGVPWAQGVWGEDSLNYPAGTGVLIALWAWLSKLDVRDAASVLSFVSYCLAALALAHGVTRHGRGGIRVAAMLLALALLFIAYMMPLHQSYVHMEGLGRVLAFGFLAMVGVVVIAACTRALGAAHAMVMLAVLMFVLACLNPINVVAASLMTGAGALWAFTGRRWMDGAALLLSLSGVALVLIDPYFLGMVTGGPSVEKVALEGFGVVAVADGIRAGLADLVANPLTYAGAASEVFPGAPRLASILLLFALGITWLCILRRSGAGRLAMSALAALAVASVALSISQQFGADKRFFLLVPYLPVALAQMKILLVMALSIAIMAETAARRRLFSTIVVGIALVLGSGAVIRPGANFHLAPKHDYCGGVECPAPDDVAVLDRFRAYLEVQGVDPDTSEDRLLIANQVIKMGPELWLFPSGGGRLAPHADVGPVAFFYFQGDPDYTTRNYVAHVCERFDVPWLREQKVRYVLIPAAEGSWCIHDADALTRQWETVVASGNARVIDLNREVHVP